MNGLWLSRSFNLELVVPTSSSESESQTKAGSLRQFAAVTNLSWPCAAALGCLLKYCIEDPHAPSISNSFLILPLSASFCFLPHHLLSAPNSPHICSASDHNELSDQGSLYNFSIYGIHTEGEIAQ